MTEHNTAIIVGSLEMGEGGSNDITHNMATICSCYDTIIVLCSW